jgi:hypothetical protein
VSGFELNIVREAPVAPSRRYHLYSPKAGETLTVVCLDHVLVLALVHFFRGQTRPCWKTDCPYCSILQRGPNYSKGYVYSWFPRMERFGILELPNEAARSFAHQSSDLESVRGTQWTAGRPKGGNNGRVVVKSQFRKFAAAEKLIELPILDTTALLLQKWQSTALRDYAEFQATKGGDDASRMAERN